MAEMEGLVKWLMFYRAAGSGGGLECSWIIKLYIVAWLCVALSFFFFN